MNTKVSIGTLLRHEWRLNGSAVWGIIAVQVALLVLHSILGHLPVSWTNSLIGKLIYTGHVLDMIASCVVAVVAWVLLISSYYNSMHGKYAFFTASVPVRGSKHLWVKAVYAWAAVFLAIGLSVLNLIAGSVEIQGRSINGAMLNMQISGVNVEMGSVEGVSESGSALNSAGVGAANAGVQAAHAFEYVKALIVNNPSVTALIIAGALLWVALVVSGVAFIVTAGSSQRMRQYGNVGGIVLTGIFVYLAAQAVSILFILLLPFSLKMDSDSWSGFSIGIRPFGSMEAYNEIPLGAVIAPILLIVGFMYLTARQLNKKLSL